MAHIHDIKIGNTNYLIEPTLYGAAATSDSGANYTLTLSNFELANATGVAIQIKFPSTNAASAKLNVNSTGAKNIFYNGAAIAASQLKANHTYTLVYDGTQWQLVGDINTNTWNALSTSQAGYVAKAPNDTTKFLRGDASWAVLPAASSSVAGITKVGASGGAAAYSHTHNASDINDGTLNTTRLPDDVVKKRGSLNSITEEVELVKLNPGVYNHTTNPNNLLPTGYGTIFNNRDSYKYGALIATETDNNFYYRAYYYNTDTDWTWRGSWQMIAHANKGTAVGNDTTPIYITNSGVITAGTALKDLAYIAKGSGSTKFLREDGTWQTALTSHQSLSAYAPLASPALTGTPTAPTANNGTSTTQIATTEFVNNTLSYVNAMRFKGTLGTGGTITALPASHEAGDTYRVITAGTWAGKYCEVGTLIICVKDGTAAADADWTSVETNEDGSVISSSTDPTDNAIVRYDGNTGRIIQKSGVTIDDSNNVTIPGTIYFSSNTSTTTGKPLFSYNASYTKFGIWYKEGSPDVMAFSASGNGDSTTSADFAVEGGGKLYNLGKIIPHTGNDTGSVGGTNGPVYVDGGQIKACTTYANATVAKAGAANLTTTTNALAYYTNTTGTFGDASKITVYNNIDITVQSATKKRNGLRLSGVCYGNTAADLTSNTAGVMRYEDGGVRIEFSADSSDNAALLYTNHNNANTGGGASFHFVGQQGSDNTGGNLAVTAPDLVARKRFMVGKNFIDANYTFYSNGSSYINGATTINGLVTVSGTSATHKGIKIGNTYINAIDGNLILQNNSTIRFGGDNWDYNIWAGLKYDHSSKTVSLGIADGTTFTANSAQSDGILNFPGINKIVLTKNTGGIYKYYGTASTAPTIQINSNNLDVSIIKIDGNDPTDIRDSQAFGFNLKYIGTGSSAGNTLRLIADNSGGTDITAMEWSGDGKVGIGTTYNTNYRLYINGATYLGGNTTLEGSSTISRAGKSINWNYANTYAMIRMTSQAGWSPLWAMKANSGWWTMGHYNNASYNNHLLFTFLNDSDVAGVSGATNHMDYIVRLIPTIYTNTSSTERAFVTAPWASSKAAVGNSTQPVYINDDGVATACTTYANATVAAAGKATNDSDDNAINTTYLKKSGGTMSGILTAWGSQYGDSYGGALNMNNSNIYGLNSIYTADTSDNASEGIHFYRDATHVDTLWMNGGALLFVPNRTLGTGTTAANSQKVLRGPATITDGYVFVANGTDGLAKQIQATNSNTASTIVQRDASGNFSAGTITGALTGNADTATAIETAGTTAQFYRGDNSWSDTISGGLFKITNNSNTVTIGSQDASFTHIYNSATIPFIFNNSILTTSGNLGSSSYPFNNLYIGAKGAKGIYYVGTNSTNQMITFVDNTSDAYGNGIKIGGGGVVVVGAGESATNLSVTAGSEILYLTSDGAINIEAGGDTIANRIGLQVTTAGHIIPVKAESANNNKQNLGASGNRWAKVYVGSADSYGDAYTPIYWNNGVPTEVAVVQKYTFSIANNSTTAVITPTNTNKAKSIVTEIVVDSGIEYLNGPISWTIPTTGTNKDNIVLTTTISTSGAVSGYILVSIG